VKVRHDEGVANRIGPEPCAGVHEGIREDVHGGVGEASVGECIGQPLSRERPFFRAPTPFCRRKATRMDTTARVSIWPGVVGEPGMCRRSLSLGTGRARVRPLGLRPPVRIGKARSRSR
jgi:hypothetical protein